MEGTLLMTEEIKKEPHPWGHFLNARWRAILWMEEVMNYSDKEIAIHLSMDEIQVYLIRTSTLMPIPDGSIK